MILLTISEYIRLRFIKVDNNYKVMLYKYENFLPYFNGINVIVNEINSTFTELIINEDDFNILLMKYNYRAS